MLAQWLHSFQTQKRPFKSFFKPNLFGFYPVQQFHEIQTSILEKILCEWTVWISKGIKKVAICHNNFAPKVEVCKFENKSLLF